MNQFRSRLAMLSLAICALATAPPPAAAQDDERTTVSAQAAAPPNVTAFAADSAQTTSSFMRAMQYVDSMPASKFSAILMALMLSVMLVAHVATRRRSYGDEDDDGARWRNLDGLTVMSARPGGGH